MYSVVGLGEIRHKAFIDWKDGLLGIDKAHCSCELADIVPYNIQQRSENGLEMVLTIACVEHI